MGKQLDVNYNGSFAYSIRIEEDYSRFKDCLKLLDTEGRKALIVTDENVAPLYLSEVREILNSVFSAVDFIALTPGEEHKNIEAVEKIYEKAILFGMDRKDYFVALGGGVVGDMTGFAAASYLRGIRFIQLPTTLLSQVDSSIGGKTGVDFKQYKNMVGAFHMPSLVYSSVGALKTLDDTQFASGMGEVIKHALIRSRSYFAELTEHISELQERDLPFLMETVYQSNLIKAAVVERDPKEQGERQILNYGHTLGHAIEKCSNFSYTHGQCVIFGCLLALMIQPVLKEEEKQELFTLLEAVGLSTRLKPMDISEILAATKRDKKMDKGQVRFILLHELGDAYIERSVPEEKMRAALETLMGE